MSYVHHVEGRLRVRSDGVRRDAATAAALRQRLASLDGVERVETSTVTGSITVWYHPARISADALTGELCRAGHLPGDDAQRPTLPATPVANDRSALGGAGGLAATAVRAAAAALVETLVERAAIAAVRALI